MGAYYTSHKLDLPVAKNNDDHGTHAFLGLETGAWESYIFKTLVVED